MHRKRTDTEGRRELGTGVPGGLDGVGGGKAWHRNKSLCQSLAEALTFSTLPTGLESRVGFRA